MPSKEPIKWTYFSSAPGYSAGLTPALWFQKMDPEWDSESVIPNSDFSQYPLLGLTCLTSSSPHRLVILGWIQPPMNSCNTSQAPQRPYYSSCSPTHLPLPSVHVFAHSPPRPLLMWVYYKLFFRERYHKPLCLVMESNSNKKVFVVLSTCPDISLNFWNHPDRNVIQVQ